MSDIAPEYLRWSDGSYSACESVQVVPDAERTDGDVDEIEVIASTQQVASDGDLLELRTWRTGWYLRSLGKGGPVLADHDPRQIIGVATRVRRDEAAGVLRAWYRHRQGDSPAAVEARRRREDGIRMPVSVRWRPGKVTRADELPKEHPLYRDKPIKIATPWGEIERMPRVHQHCTLREISETPIPADLGAVAVRAAGVVAPVVGVDPEADSLDERVADAIRAMLERGDLSDVMAEAVATYAASLPRTPTNILDWRA